MPPPINLTESTTPPAVLATRMVDYGWIDANFVVQGICFEAAEQRLGQIYIIRNSSELEQFYSQVDRSQLCEEPIERETFTFNAGDLLVGLWSGGRGCTAEHVVQNVQRENANRQIAIQLQLVIHGDCPYELIRPFWIAIKDAEGFNVQINVLAPP